MPDELEALRHFRDETPGPSTDAWNRARAAIAAARAEEEPAGRQPARLPGQHSRRRVLGQRRLLVIAAGCAVATVAALLAVLLPGSPGSRGTGGQIETTAFVTRVEHALSGQRNVVEYARTILPPGHSAVPAPGGLRVFPSNGAGSPWSVGYLVRWSYQGTDRISAFTSAGQRIFDMTMAPTGGVQSTTVVLYRSGTWWRAAPGPGSVAGGPAPTSCGPEVVLGPGGWPAFIRHELSCGEYRKAGQQRIDGIETTKITGNGRGGLETLWVNPRTYLPVRAIVTVSGVRLQTDVAWLTPTKARLAQLHVPVPAAFREVSPP